MFESFRLTIILTAAVARVASQQQPASNQSYCMELYRQDVLQWWTVENSSFLCNVNWTSTDPDKLGLQAIGGRLYISSKFDNLSIDQYWLTERSGSQDQLSVYVHRKNQRAAILLTIEKTNDRFKIASNRLMTSGKMNSQNRTVYYVGEKDIKLRAGENNYLIIWVAFLIVLIITTLCSAVFKSPGLSTVFVCCFYFVNALLQGLVQIAYASSLITVLALTSVPCAFIATLHHRFGLRIPSYVLVTVLIIFFGYSVHLRFTSILILGSLAIGISGILARSFLASKDEDLNDSTEEDKRPFAPFVQIVLYNICVLWISMSLLYYYPGELVMRFKSQWVAYPQFEKPTIINLSAYCSLLTISLAVIVAAQTMKLDTEGDESDTSYRAEDDNQRTN